MGLWYVMRIPEKPGLISEAQKPHMFVFLWHFTIFKRPRMPKVKLWLLVVPHYWLPPISLAHQQQHALSLALDPVGRSPSLWVPGSCASQVPLSNRELKGKLWHG